MSDVNFEEEGDFGRFPGVGEVVDDVRRGQLFVRVTFDFGLDE